MFEPFPGNYVWNLSVNLTLMCGGNIGEVDRACRPIREAAARAQGAGTAQFFDAWLAVTIAVTFLITHGASDRRIPIAYAHQSYDQAVDSPKRELKIFTPYDFEIEHCGADNGTVTRDYLADWIGETLV